MPSARLRISDETVAISPSGASTARRASGGVEEGSLGRRPQRVLDATLRRDGRARDREESGLDIPFIIVSGTTGEEAALEAMRAGAHDFFVKGNLVRLLPAIEREARDAAGRAERKKMQEERLLSDRLVSIGTLAAGVAHEINNPLAYVMGNIDFVLDKFATGDCNGSIPDLAEVVLALQQAREGSERIRITARDIKVFCHTDYGAPTSVDVPEVLESAIRMAWNEIRHRARLVKVFAHVPRVDANENRLAQVFLNLLVNAAQAITEGNAAGNEIRSPPGTRSIA